VVLYRIIYLSKLEIINETSLNEKGFKKKIMKLITCHIPEAYLSGIEELVNMNLYPNRSEVIRVAIRDLLKTELSEILRKRD
jgi:hypothetical protein